MHLPQLILICTLVLIYISATRDNVASSEIPENAHAETKETKKNGLDIPLQFKRDKTKTRFECSEVHAATKVATPEVLDGSTKKITNKLFRDYPSINGYQTLQKLYGESHRFFLANLPVAFVEAYRLDLDEAFSFFKSSVIFFIQLAQESKLEELNDEFLASLKPYNGIQVGFQNEELRLTYPPFFQRLKKRLKKIPPSEQEGDVNVIALLKISYQLFPEEFARNVKKEFSALLERHCNENEEKTKEVSFFLWNSPSGEKYYMKKVEMLADFKKESFECHYPVGGLVKIVHRRFVAEQQRVFKSLEGLCPEKKTVLATASKEFGEPFVEGSRYVGTAFFTLLKECVATSLPELSKELFADTSYASAFIEEVNFLAKKLIEKKMKKEEIKSLVSKSDKVKLDFKKNWVAYIWWKPILDISIVNEALKKSNSLNLITLKEILRNHTELQALFIKYVLYQSWNAACKASVEKF